MSRFTHKFREKFKDLRKRHWGKNRHKFGKCAPLKVTVSFVMKTQGKHGKPIIPGLQGVVSSACLLAISMINVASFSQLIGY